MSAPVKLALIVYVTQGRFTTGTHLTANVQCWRDGECFQTIDLASGYDVDLPAEMDISTVDGYAAAAARVTSRHLEDVFKSAMEKQIFNRIADFDEPENADA